MRAELLDADLQGPLLGRQALLVGFHLGDLLGQTLHLVQGQPLAFDRHAGKVVATRGDGAVRLVVELRDARLEPVRLLLELLLGRGDVHQPTPQGDQQLLLLVVGIVEDLARVLRPIEGAAHLGVEQQPQPCPKTHRRLLVEKSGRLLAKARPKLVSEAVPKQSQFQSQLRLRPLTPNA
jgi:hypothetical protein